MQVYNRITYETNIFMNSKDCSKSSLSTKNDFVSAYSKSKN